MTQREILVWDKVFKSLDDGKPIRSQKFEKDEQEIVSQLPLITAKPLIFVCNLDAESMKKGSNEMSEKFKAYVNEKYPGIPCLEVSAILENEIA